MDIPSSSATEGSKTVDLKSHPVAKTTASAGTVSPFEIETVDPVIEVIEERCTLINSPEYNCLKNSSFPWSAFVLAVKNKALRLISMKYHG
jgi:hypothetical protein